MREAAATAARALKQPLYRQHRAIRGEVGNMSWPTIRFDADVLRVLVSNGPCCSVAFVAVALCYELELYADGAMFSYAVAVQDVWAFHWHNISGRMSVFFLGLLPAETYVGLSGDPRAGSSSMGCFSISRRLRGYRHFRGRPLTRPHHLCLRLLFDRPALPADLRLSDRNVAAACHLLAGARRLPLCEADRRRNTRSRHDGRTRFHP